MPEVEGQALAEPAHVQEGQADQFREALVADLKLLIGHRRDGCQRPPHDVPAHLRAQDLDFGQFGHRD